MSTKDTVKDLVQTLEDGRKGFSDAAEKLAKDGNDRLAATFRSFAEQRSRFSEQLRQTAMAAGIAVDEDGTVAGALHRGWMSLKDALTGDDADAIVEAARTGDDHAVSEFEDALDEDLPQLVESTVRTQADEIRETRDQLATLTS